LAHFAKLVWSGTPHIATFFPWSESLDKPLDEANVRC